MPLTVPPQVQIGTDPTWRATAFTTDLLPAEVQRGTNVLAPDGVEFFYWSVAVGDDAPQVVRLLLAGPTVQAGDVGQAVVVSAGRWWTRLLIVQGAQRIIRPGSVPLSVG